MSWTEVDEARAWVDWANTTPGGWRARLDEQLVVAEAEQVLGVDHAGLRVVEEAERLLAELEDEDES
ncbi:hypothetical protein [uncultured Friedmanniella sp.]|uniref:hypothetical protein n=1 Tax=uncultured Friedmanniella sp. TaxID=335381 RepID=UPI0035CA2614